MSDATVIAWERVRASGDTGAQVASILVDVGRTLESGGTVPTADLVRVITWLASSLADVRMATIALLAEVDKNTD